jgi:hypothetical protein
VKSLKQGTICLTRLFPGVLVGKGWTDGLKPGLVC